MEAVQINTVQILLQMDMVNSEDRINSNNLRSSSIQGNHFSQEIQQHLSLPIQHRKEFIKFRKYFLELPKAQILVWSLIDKSV